MAIISEKGPRAFYSRARIYLPSSPRARARLTVYVVCERVVLLIISSLAQEIHQGYHYQEAKDAPYHTLAAPRNTEEKETAWRPMHLCFMSFVLCVLRCSMRLYKHIHTL